MFGFFKKRQPASGDPFTRLIKHHVVHSVTRLDQHRQLLAAAPNPDLARFHAFLFNLWLGYHFIVEEIARTLPASADDEQLDELRDQIREAMTRTANEDLMRPRGSQFAKAFQRYEAEYDFPTYAEIAFVEYDSALERETPPWLGAANYLHVCCGLGRLAATDAQRAAALQQEVGALFEGVQKPISTEAQAYLQSRT